MTAVVQRNPSILFSEVDGETVMMDSSFETYFGMQAVASRIWQMLADPVQVETLCINLTNEFDVSLEQCRRDVESFLVDLYDQDMIVQV